MFIGLILLAIGLIALLIKLDILTGSIWGYAWPTILILIGLAFIFGGRRRRSFFTCCHFPREDDEKK